MMPPMLKPYLDSREPRIRLTPQEGRGLWLSLLMLGLVENRGTTSTRDGGPKDYVRLQTPMGHTVMDRWTASWKAVDIYPMGLRTAAKELE